MMKHMACSGMGLVLLLGLSSLPAGAQSQPSTTPSGSSLGDYARQIRKDPGTASSKTKVFDNDNLPRQDKLSVVGPAPATNATGEAKAAETEPATANNAKAEAEAKSEKAPVTSTKKAPEENKVAAAKQWSDKIDAQKQEIDLWSRGLDVVQREYQIRAAAMYADAGNRMRNSADWDKQDAQFKQQIADKQKSLEDAKAKLEDLQEEARKAGAPASVRE
jgi:hypothetical protein